VIDEMGNELPNLTITWRVVAKSYSELGEQSSSRTVFFDSVGTQTIIARVARRIDSLSVVVAPRRKR